MADNLLQLAMDATKGTQTRRGGAKASDGGGGGGQGEGAEDFGWYKNDVELNDCALEAALQRALIKEEMCVSMKVAAARREDGGIRESGAVVFTVAQVVEAFCAAVAVAGGCSMPLVSRVYLHFGIFVWEKQKDAKTAFAHIKTALKCDGDASGARLVLSQVLHKGLKESKAAEAELRQLLGLCGMLSESDVSRDLKFQTLIELVGLLSRYV